MQRDADTNLRDNECQTLLHKLCQNTRYSGPSNDEIVKFLVRKGADPNLQDQYNRKPAYYAKCDSKTEKLFDVVSGVKIVINIMIGGFMLLSASASFSLMLSYSSTPEKVIALLFTAVCACVALHCVYNIVQDQSII